MYMAPHAGYVCHTCVPNVFGFCADSQTYERTHVENTHISLFMRLGGIMPKNMAYISYYFCWFFVFSISLVWLVT